MVQYVFTPWRDRQELLKVRQQFYPQHHSQPSGAQGVAALGSSSALSPSAKHHLCSQGVTLSGNAADSQDGESDPRMQQQHEAVARVSMWMQRGNCPHLVESTALLMAAILSDQQATTMAATAEGPRGVAEAEDGAPSWAMGSGSVLLSSSTYAARAAYSTAFSRFVTGLLDSHQDRQHKMSMYAIAKSVGLPATFVELRHQATHEQLPSLTRLRATARKALDWIYEYYWKQLSDVSKPERTGEHLEPENDTLDAALRDLVDQYLEEEDSTKRMELKEAILAWDGGNKATIAAVDSAMISIRDARKLKTAMDLFREVVDRSVELDRVGESQGETAMDSTNDPDLVRAEIEKFRQGLDSSETDDADSPSTNDGEDNRPGWSRHEGPWIPKPIGMV